MAIRKIPVPFCDVCGEPSLPRHRLADGTINPIFEHPERTKRCGKCKSTRWNAAGVDRRRKAVVDSPAEAFIASDVDTTVEEIEAACAEVPQVTVQDVEQTMDNAAALELAVMERNSDPMVAAAAEEVAKAIFYPNVRCKHGLYSCPECHHQEAA